MEDDEVKWYLVWLRLLKIHKRLRQEDEDGALVPGIGTGVLDLRKRALGVPWLEPRIRNKMD